MGLPITIPTRTFADLNSAADINALMGNDEYLDTTLSTLRSEYDTSQGTFSEDVKDEIETNFNVSGTAPLYACRAWVNFNGTASAESMIRDSGNVDSITDNGTGNYTINFITSMEDTNYCAVMVPSCKSSETVNRDLNPFDDGYLTSSIKVRCLQSGSTTLRDQEVINIVIFR